MIIDSSKIESGAYKLNIEKQDIVSLVEDTALSLKAYIEENNLKSQIIIHHGDALSFDLEHLKIKKYDCLFIDAAKAQYQKFFEKYMPLVADEGICIVDNLDFHGMIFDIDNIKNRNTKQLVKKIKRFKDWIFDNELYDVEYHHVGDGICVIRKRVAQ